MATHQFRPTLARTQNSMKIINGTKTNATIRNIEEEEGELEEKEGTIVSIKRDLINGAGWSVKDDTGQIYVCSCASSMYEVPESVERGGILYPKEDIKVTFTVNPVLRINIIKEIKSTDEEAKKIDISKWTHEDEATTVIAKPKSALSISDGLIKMNYNNDNQIKADENGITTEGGNTNINTDKLSINSNNIELQGVSLEDAIGEKALGVSNAHSSFNVGSLPTIDMILDRSNNMTEINITSGKNSVEIDTQRVIGQIKDQKSIPLKTQTQQLLTDGNCIDIVTIDTDGVISISPTENSSCKKPRVITSTHHWVTPQIQSRNYIKVTVKQICDNCDDGNNGVMEYVNYCPKCKEWNKLSNAGTFIRCGCGEKYCQNCGTGYTSGLKLKKFLNNYVVAYGTTCEYCDDQLESGTIKYYIDYCPNCKEWNVLNPAERETDIGTINILRCSSCDSEFCNSCGIDQDNHGITLTNAKTQYTDYKNALRKLKYVKDGA